MNNQENVPQIAVSFQNVFDQITQPINEMKSLISQLNDFESGYISQFKEEQNDLNDALEREPFNINYEDTTVTLKPNAFIGYWHVDSDEAQTLTEGINTASKDGEVRAPQFIYEQCLNNGTTVSELQRALELWNAIHNHNEPPKPCKR